VSCYKTGSERQCPICQEKRIRERSSKVCQSCFRSIHSHGRETANVHDPIAEVVPATPPVAFDEKYEAFNAWIGRTDRCVEPPAFEGEEHTIVHLADCHVPFCNLDALRSIVSATRGAGTCVVGGDFFNAAAFSRFVSTDNDFVGAKDELTQAQTVLQYISENYTRVILRRGNHPDRIKKYFGARVPPELMFLVTTDILPLLAAGLPNVEIAAPLLPQFGNSHWITMVGDCAFTHAETHSKIPMRPVGNVEAWLTKWGAHLPRKPAVICQEHNHKAGMMVSQDGQTLLIHTPALSMDVDYQWQASMAWTPNQTGYTRICQDENGTTDWNASGFVLWRGGEEKEA
jgi:hypothetical protein